MSPLFSMLLDYALHLDLIWRCKDTNYFSFHQIFPQLFSPLHKHLTFPPLAFNIQSIKPAINNQASHVTWDFSRFSIPTPQSRHSLSLSTLKFRGSTFDIPSIYLRCTFAFCFRGSIGTYKWHPTCHYNNLRTLLY